MQSRRDFLTGFVGGAAGVGGGQLAWRQFVTRPFPSDWYHVCYGQYAEDLVIAGVCEGLGLTIKSYFDIGAFHPVLGNNTYLFYEKGARGVLVEPNVSMIPELTSVRKHDKVLNIGIGVTDVKEADYYVMTFPQRNTFSKEEAEEIERKSNKAVKIEKVVKMPLVNVNAVIAQNFDGTPNFVSLDTEGFEEAILKSWDFKKYRPEVFCIDTLEADTNKQRTGIFDLMKGNGYVERAGTWANTIFLEKKLLD